MDRDQARESQIDRDREGERESERERERERESVNMRQVVKKKIFYDNETKRRKRVQNVVNAFQLPNRPEFLNKMMSAIMGN